MDLFFGAFNFFFFLGCFLIFADFEAGELWWAMYGGDIFAVGSMECRGLYVSYLRIRVKWLRDWAAGLSLFLFFPFLFYIPGGFLSFPFPIHSHLLGASFFHYFCFVLASAASSSLLYFLVNVSSCSSDSTFL